MSLNPLTWFRCCEHKWTLLNTYGVREHVQNGESRIIAQEYHLQCEKCGDIKIRRS